MGTRQCPETTQALALIKAGATVREAAKQAGVWPTTLYAALKRLKVPTPAAKQARRRKKVLDGKGGPQNERG